MWGLRMDRGWMGIESGTLQVVCLESIYIVVYGDGQRGCGRAQVRPGRLQMRGKR